MSRNGTAPQPCADCTADTGGALTFELTATAATGLPEARPVALVLKRRGSEDRVRLELTEAGAGRLRTVLSTGTELAEGRWDAFAECGPADERRIEPGLRDLRTLLDRVPSAGARTVVARVPYRAADGKLSLRCWVRSPHAEAGELTVEAAALTVRGQIYAAVLGTDAVVEARLRGVPGRVHQEAVTDAGNGAFSCTLPYRPLAGEGPAESRLWDLWLLPDGPAGPQVRISRILDDVADRKSIFVYPPSFLGSGDEPAARAAPYYTVDNDLSVRVDPQKR